MLWRGNDGEFKEERDMSSLVASHVTDVTFLSNLPDEDLRLRHGQVHGLLLREGEDGVRAALWLCRFRGNELLFFFVMTCCCDPQTHSAYMLFYKRVEPEEENGKDFSFDVSPDLLEVRHVTLSGVFFFCGHVRLLHSRPCLSLSVDLARQHAVPPGQKYI